MRPWNKFRVTTLSCWTCFSIPNNYAITYSAIILFLLIVTIAVTALAGFYPSIVLSRFKPVNALKSKLTANSAKGISLRRGLVVFQFIIAQALIIGTLIIVKQMNYFINLLFEENFQVNEKIIFNDMLKFMPFKF